MASPNAQPGHGGYRPPTGPPPPPAFDSTNTYLVGTYGQQDDHGYFTLPVTILASQIIGMEQCPTTFSNTGYPYTQVNVLVPGLTIGFINADYPTLLAQWQTVVSAYVTPPSSTPANTLGLTAALESLEGLEPTTTSPTKKRKKEKMTSPVFVQILQSDLDTFAEEFAAVSTDLQTYIAQLVANQAVPLSAASEAGLATALAKLQALEPPAPTPPPVSF
jgi:hypothetical protein